MKHLKWIIPAMAMTVALASCETKEDQKVFSAQKCLNSLPASPTPADVDVCLAKIDGVNTNDANIIRCSAYFIRGGLTNSKIIQAYEAFDAAADNEKEAVLIKNLSLGDTPQAKADADAAYEYCNRTSVPGLAYVASLCRIGTMVDQMTCGGTCGSIEDQITDFVQNADTADKEQVGQMAEMLGSLYCVGDAAESNICVEIKSAIAHANGDHQLLAEYLLNFFID